MRFHGTLCSGAPAAARWVFTTSQREGVNIGVNFPVMFPMIFPAMFPMLRRGVKLVPGGLHRCEVAPLPGAIVAKSLHGTGVGVNISGKLISYR